MKMRLITEGESTPYTTIIPSTPIELPFETINRFISNPIDFKLGWTFPPSMELDECDKIINTDLIKKIVNETIADYCEENQYKYYCYRQRPELTRDVSFDSDVRKYRVTMRVCFFYGNEEIDIKTLAENACPNVNI